MKKMGKFRKWLIHKLGGICPDDAIQPLQVESRKAKSLYINFNMSNQAYASMRKDMTEEEVYQEMKKFFEHNWGELVIDYATITKEQRDEYIDWISKLEIVEKGDDENVAKNNR